MATDEFRIILRPGGWFVSLWNPRFIEKNPLLVEIENKITEICPNIQRVFCGRSSFTEQLTDRLESWSEFDSRIYLEGRPFSEAIQV